MVEMDQKQKSFSVYRIAYSVPTRCLFIEYRPNEQSLINPPKTSAIPSSSGISTSSGKQIVLKQQSGNDITTSTTSESKYVKRVRIKQWTKCKNAEQAVDELRKRYPELSLPSSKVNPKLQNQLIEAMQQMLFTLTVTQPSSSSSSANPSNPTSKEKGIVVAPVIPAVANRPTSSRWQEATSHDDDDYDFANDFDNKPKATPSALPPSKQTSQSNTKPASTSYAEEDDEGEYDYDFSFENSMGNSLGHSSGLNSSKSKITTSSVPSVMNKITPSTNSNNSTIKTIPPPVVKNHKDLDNSSASEIEEDDDLDDFDFDELDAIGKEDSGPKKKPIQAMTSFDPNNHTTKSNNSNKYAQEEEEFEVVKPDDLLQIDLNKCSDDINRKAKQIMNDAFEANRLKPGDEGFVYDVQKEFDACEDNEWDEEDD